MADHPKSQEPLRIDVISDVVCPWCFIGKRRLEKALALKPDVPVDVHFHPYFLNPWVPREGMSRNDYLTTKFGSPERYKAIAGRVAAAAAEEGLVYASDKMARQPNTTDAHRLILWASAIGKAPQMKQRIMDLYFTEGADLSDREVLVKAAARCRPGRRRNPRQARHRRRSGPGRTGSQLGQGHGHRRRADLHPGRGRRDFGRAVARGAGQRHRAGRQQPREVHRRGQGAAGRAGLSYRSFRDAAKRRARNPEITGILDCAGFRVRAGACQRAGLWPDPLARPGMTRLRFQ